MNRYPIPCTCPHCGGALEHVADGTAGRWWARSVTACRPCKRRFVLAVTLQPVETAA